MNIIRTDSADGTCILTFDRPGSSANIFDRATLDELEIYIAALEKESGVRGVVLTSAKPAVFIAGADLNALAKNLQESALTEIIDLGHRVFTRLSRLAAPTVAAIHGACLGGGLEVALACDWRVASTDKATKLGLPETQLGILPAWGGSTRLPKLIGLPAALSLILTGKQIVGAQALKLGVVDDIAHSEYLLDAARQLIARGKRLPSKNSWLSRTPFSALVAIKARRDLRAKTRGHYPAPIAALDVCAHAVGEPLERGLERERAAFLQLVHTPECKNLMSVFFLQERAKKLEVAQASLPVLGRMAQPSLPASDKTRVVPSPRVRRTAVIGAGTMGAGIAQWISARGYPVQLNDVSPEALARGLHSIEKVYSDAVKRHVFTRAEATAGLDRITPVHTAVSLVDVDLVIEAAVEKLELKQQIFRNLESRVGPDTVLATNTSALSIDKIASVLTRPERVVGIHFFNPVHRMQLVEIVRGSHTSPQALDIALRFVKAIGKLPVMVNDSPGFLVNRILMPYLVEAVWLFSEGVPVRTIDGLMLDFGMPMGPLRLCDEVGLDVALHVAKDLERRLPRPIRLSHTLAKMVASGWLGKKSGRGFYNYEARGKRETPNVEAKPLQLDRLLRTPTAAAQLDRMVLIMINEAARALDERVVDAPEDVDFAMIMGTGWAPFRGGPLRYADALGVAQVVGRLETLVRDVAAYFEPSERLRAMARQGRTFYGGIEAKVAPDRVPPSKPTPTRLMTFIPVS